MKMRSETIPINNQRYYYEKPNVCPHCGLVVDTTAKLALTGSVCVIIFTCPAADCGRLSYATYSINTEAKNLSLQTTYPLPQMEGIPQSLVELSPEFANRCREAFAAENLEHYGLAACGYRNAIEAVIKDYVLAYLEPDIDLRLLRRQSIDECIRLYLSDIDTTVSAFFTKDLGNRATHHPKIEGEEVDYDEFKIYFGLFLMSMDSKVRIRRLQAGLPSRHALKFDSPPQSTAPQDEEAQ